MTLQATTSGTPAAGIGTGLLFNAESADEAPSNVGALDFIATDVTAGSEDTVASIKLRVAGRALDEKYRLASTAGDGFTVTFTHAVTADRTVTFPDQDVTIGADTMATTWADVTGSRAKDTVYQNTTGKTIFVAVTVSMASNANNAARLKVGSANPPTIVIGRGGWGGSLGSANALIVPLSTIAVPNNWYYTVEQQAGTISIDSWAETS